MFRPRMLAVVRLYMKTYPVVIQIYVWVVYRGLGGCCVGARSGSGQIKVRGSGYSREPS
jgi:hypothetical protein